jgi:hypothetical protein
LLLVPGLYFTQKEKTMANNQDLLHELRGIRATLVKIEKSLATLATAARYERPKAFMPQGKGRRAATIEQVPDNLEEGEN